MSRYIDISQLLGELGTSDRSAGDPWALSRSRSGTVKGDAFNPAVEADLGAPLQDLKSEIQSSAQITQAATVSSNTLNSSGGTSSSSGSNFMGGLLNLFPLASGIAKLFGFGDSTPSPALTPYQLPPSINFAGAVSGATVGGLSYGSDGLPRTSVPTRSSSSNFTDTPAAVVSNISKPFLSEGNTVGTGGGLVAGTTESATGIADPIGTVGSTNFVAEPAAGLSTLGSALVSSTGTPTSVGNAAGGNGLETGAAAVSDSSGRTAQTQQGHSILVQVQAMDSQSFMDHSQEIAQAVRQAMLNLNSLNDVVQDL